MAEPAVNLTSPSSTPAPATAQPTAQPTPEAAATPAAPVETPEAKRARQIAKAEAAMRESSIGDEPASEPVAAAPLKDPKTGKFLPRQKVKAEAKPATVEPTEPKEAATSEPSRDETAQSASPRALLDSGKFDEAFKAAFGEDVDPRRYRIDSRSWASFRQEVRKEREKLGTMRQQVETRAGELVKTYEPFAEAKRLYDSGDLAGMVRVITNGDMDASEFNRRLLHSQYSKDPEVEKLRRELREEREARTAREQKAEQEAAEQQAQQARQQFVEQLTDELTGCEDPRVAKAAKRPAFVRQVFAVLQKHYDPQTGTTLPIPEAAEMVLEQVHSEHSFWSSEVFGAGQPQLSEIPNQGGTAPAKSGAARPPPRTLRQSEAAEAAPRGKLSRDQLIAKYTPILRQSSLE